MPLDSGKKRKVYKGVINDTKSMKLTDRLLSQTLPASPEEDLTQEALRANALLQQAEKAPSAAEAYTSLKQYRALVAQSAQKDIYDVDGSNEIIAKHLLAAAEKRGITYQELLMEQGDETLQQAIAREFKRFKGGINDVLIFEDELSIRWHAMQHAYDAACGYVIGGIHASLEQQDPSKVASDRFHHWFNERIKYLKEIGSRIKADDTELPERLEPVCRAKQQIEEGACNVLEQEHDKHYEAFQNATTLDDAVRAFVPLIGMSITYQRLLEVNPENLVSSITAKLEQLGAELAISEQGTLMIETTDARYITDLPPVTEWSAQQTDVQQYPLPRTQTAQPVARDSEEDDYSIPVHADTQKEPTTPAQKNGKSSRLERALGTLGTVAVVGVLGFGAAYMIQARSNRPEPPTMTQRVEQLPRIEIPPEQEAVYVSSFHHTAQEQAYLDLRRAGWCPTQEAIKKLALPVENGTRPTWEEIYAKRAELLRMYATDPVYACRR